MSGFVIRRGPTRKIVSGIYPDEDDAQAKADDLDDRRPFSYSVEPWG